MKRKLQILVFIIFLGLGIREVKASSITVTASPNTATSGGRVTFYINIKDAAAWQLTGKGTGATSGCSLGDQGVGDSGNGRNTNKSLAVTCNATSVGQISFSVSGNITDANTNKAIDVSGRKVIAVQAPREKDTNNYLKSLSVKDYKITPDFNKETLEYSVEVPSTVNNIVIEASAESGYAQLTGTGDFEVDEGTNNFDIKVTSETGVERVYKLTVTVKDENPIDVKVGDGSYTILKNVKNVEKPDLYEETVVKINGIDVPAYVSDVTNFTLVVVKDESGKNHFAIYNQENNSYQLYEEQKSQKMVLYLMDLPENLDGFIETKIEFNDISYPAYQVVEGSEYYLVYAMNVETGVKNYYLYYAKDHTFQVYFEEMTDKLKEDNEKQKQIILGLAVGCVFFFLLCLLSFLKKPKRKRRKNASSLEKKKTIEENLDDSYKEVKMEDKHNSKKKRRKSRVND